MRPTVTQKNNNKLGHSISFVCVLKASLPSSHSIRFRDKLHSIVSLSENMPIQKHLSTFVLVEFTVLVMMCLLDSKLIGKRIYP